MPEVWEQGPYANDTYLRSLAKSSGDVTRQVRNALTEIARQRAVNQGRAQMIPGTTKAHFNTGERNVQSIDQQLGVSTLGSVAGAFDKGQASMGRLSGLYKQGFGERETRQRGAVKGIQNDLIHDLRQKGTEYVSKRQQEDRERQHQAALAAQQRALQIEMMNRQAAMQAAAQADARRQAEQDRAVELWMANLDNPWPGQPANEGARRAQSRYLGMKDRQNLGLR